MFASARRISWPLSDEDALGSERAAEVWERRPPGALPNEARQAKLIDWLQSEPLAADPERYPYPCLRREPKLLLKASSLPQALEVKRKRDRPQHAVHLGRQRLIRIPREHKALGWLHLSLNGGQGLAQEGKALLRRHMRGEQDADARAMAR